MGGLRGLAQAKQIVYGHHMIRSFASTETRQLFATGKSRRLPPDIWRRAMMRLYQLDAAASVGHLRAPSSNRLEALGGDRIGQWSIRINSQWRLCFRFEAGDAFDVEIVDYH
jgi:proteic killer suppression protein